jgi:tetratricopeptide (TPR) repeat protein
MQALLTIIAFLLAALVFILGGMLMHFAAMSKRGKSVSTVVFKKSDIEDLLAAGNASSARSAANSWLRAQPRNTTAYLLLAKANFQLGELVETKRILEELIEFSPDSKFVARPYLDRIEESLEKRRPRAVE